MYKVLFRKYSREIPGIYGYFCFLFLTFCLLFYTPVQAQSWQWGKGGGSMGGQFAGYEKVVDLATDPHGNVYVLSIVEDGVGNTYPINNDGHMLTSIGLVDMVVTSYRCDGTYRWSKVIGAGENDIACAVKADTMGGVYITGWINSANTQGYFDADTSVRNYKSLFLIKYDTSGVFQWLRQPQDNPPAIARSYCGPYDMDVDGSGNVHLLCSLFPGSYENGALTITDTANYMLRYNSAGVFQGAVFMNIRDATNKFLVEWRIKADFGLGRYYITGTGAELYLDTHRVNKYLFVAAFSFSGKYIWHRTDTYEFIPSGFERADVDDQHNIYLSFVSFHGDTVNGYPVINTVSTIPFYAVPLALKMDSNGNNLWAINGSQPFTTEPMSIAKMADNRAVAVASEAGVAFAGTPYSTPVIYNNGMDLYALSIDATSGTILGMDKLYSAPGFTEVAEVITGDKKGNAYIGGYFEYDIRLPHDTIRSWGGGSDYFTVKYGFNNCNCTSLPASSFSYWGSQPLVFNFTGTLPADSVVWDFGDSTRGKGLTVSHHYSADGAYSVCATVHSACGINQSCQTILITDVEEVSRQSGTLKVYPNPAKQSTRIVYNIPDKNEGVLEVYDMTGRKMDRYFVRDREGFWDLSLRDYAPGVYLIVLRSGGTVVQQTRINVVR